MNIRPGYWKTVLSVMMFFTILLQGCIGQKPIKVGVIAELTGKQSDLGIALRNGIQLAAEEINTAGGINGRPIELVIQDDLGTPQGAVDAENLVIDQDVVAIIGHLTSNQTVEGYKVAEQRGVLLLSGTASTTELSAKKDLFFRTEATNAVFAEVLAKYIIQKKGLSSISIIYDMDNQTYSFPFADGFKQTLESLGGHVPESVDFSGSATEDFAPLVSALIASNPEGVFIIASPVNTATIAQLLRLNGWDGPLFAAPWSQGQDLITYGGEAVEGLESLVGFNVNDDAPAVQEFKQKYDERYAEANPTFTAMFGYELMNVLAEGLEKTKGNAKGLGDALVQIGTFQGLEGPIYMDEFGDARRTLYIMRLENGTFSIVDEVEP